MGRTSTIYQYDKDTRQQILNYGSDSTSHLIFIHGGAWRDPNNTHHDIDQLLKYLPQNISIWSIDYRLSPQVKHPVHEQDVILALEKIHQLIEEKHGSIEGRKISLMGHSAGVSLALRTFDQVPKLKINKLILLDGIYDLTKLIEEYPDYQGFVNEAFDNYQDVSFLTSDQLNNVNIHVFQSYNDELLSKTQTEWFLDQLHQKGIDYTYTLGNFGKHEDVYQNEKIASYITSLY
ncbi:putative kynurenine formamidase [Wickerhamomyces ciferrii]|uniref:Kynurenine formamidase n=1 Tax=Wickerhamomyces ciferrii (strain ATCC 14091 / BCRC 22168 / CBS 111 / JCM 3599 / NBRC 0793 / NRRL Y-1031 F-60-10) TaxID=1206466 RepID=K0KMJ6_WICCF|nr:putative kynurenine formamidase [Wickerhamomyces ciferrii]CCH42328.1 putative kynurenine formamidase [Wickerhamomyces ciferrii]